MWRRWNGHGILAATRVPVLELWGDRGRTPPSLEQMQIPDRSNISVQWFHNCSHSLLIECPDQLAKAINAFIDKVVR
jgi:pimeloyl-ACP methyl ester carboxylesterase